MRDPVTGVTGDVDLLGAGLARIDRSTGTIYANSAQGPIAIGVDQPAAALAQIVRRRNENDPDDDDTGDAENGRARLAQLQARIQSYGGVPQRLETGIAALQIGLSGSDPDDPETQRAREHLARLQSVLAEWKQDHPDYTALNREQSDLLASFRAQQQAQNQRDAEIKASLAMPETVRMNGALPPDPLPAQGPGDVSLSDIQQRAGDLAGQMEIPPSLALRAALVEAKNAGATTVGGADITDAIRNVRPARVPAASPGATPSALPSAGWYVGAMAQELWGRAKDFGAAVEQGLTRPIAGVLGAVAVGDHFLTGTPLDDTASKQFADAINDYWNEARNPDYTDSTLSKVTGAVAPLVPSLIAGRFGGGAGAEIFNALSMGGEAMLEAKEKGWTDDQAMEMFAINLGFGAVGGRVISRSLKRINALTGGALSKYILSLAKESAPALPPVARAGLAVGQSALEGGLFGAVQTFGSEAWAKLRNLGNAGQREWSAIWNDAKSAGLQSALTMALTTIFAAGAVPPAQRRQLAEQPPSKASSLPLTSDPLTSPKSTAPATEDSTQRPRTSDTATENSAPSPAIPEPKEPNSPAALTDPSAPPVDPLARRVADLHDKAVTLRNKIVAAHESGTPEAIGDLGGHLDAEKDTQSQFHEATQDLIDSVPEDTRNRIERAAVPGLDYDAIRARNRKDPTHSFATAEIGNALRDQYLSEEAQRQIRKTAAASGVDPALADRIADQTTGAKVVQDLGSILNGGAIEPGKTRILKQMGLLKPARMSDGTRRLTITGDVLPLLPKTTQDAVTKNPKVLRVVHTKGPRADGLNRIVDGGRQRFAETAKVLPVGKAVFAPKTLRTLSPKKAREKALRAAGFQEHHIISDSNSATKDHLLLKLAGFDLQSRLNKMWLPTDAARHPSRSIHNGKHLRRVSDALGLQMTRILETGQKRGWAKEDYARALRSIIAEERKALRTGKRHLNKNARPNPQ